MHKVDYSLKLELEARIKAMLESAKSGTYVAPNRINGTPKQDFSQIPDDVTVYARM
ncbi:TPA: hypothetical protein ACX6SP_003655 [Photobacterium damselae]